MEVCFLIREAADLVESLFDTQFPKRPLALDDFSPGVEVEPQEGEVRVEKLNLFSAVMAEENKMKLKYSHECGKELKSLDLGLLSSNDTKPAVLVPLGSGTGGTRT
ncbi:MAG: hypothetical protein KC964_03310, partial [Candidatus Omnitrophica bacterium]|nr:hypothetical protein [Candidatus Omnitrophota bacterium]